MQIAVRSNSHRRRIVGGYQSKVLRMGPIAYWPLDDPTGTVARCLVDSAQNGAYTGVTLANAAGPHGSALCPLFDGTNDYVNVYTTTLRDAFSKDEGTIAIWFKAYNIGAWDDSAHRATILLQSSGPLNQFFLEKYFVENRFWYYKSDDTSAKNYLPIITPTTDWVHVAMTWSVTGNATKYYWAGADLDNADTSDSATGTLALAVIGAQSTTPTYPWHGWLSDAILFDRALSAAEILALATV